MERSLGVWRQQVVAILDCEKIMKTVIISMKRAVCLP